MSKPKFRNELAFLSNMFPCEINIALYGNILTFNSTEAAFQALKQTDIEQVKQFTSLTGYEAKKLSRQLTERPNWKSKRINIMHRLLQIKFRDPHLANKLILIDDEDLVEENNWRDTFWGVCDGKGHNVLGKLLRKVKYEILDGGKCQ